MLSSDSLLTWLRFIGALCITLGCTLRSSSALAVDWFVPTDEEAVALEGWLSDLWPEHTVDVLVGPHGEQGIWYQNGSLHVNTRTVSRAAPSSWDLPLMISTVRTWLAVSDPVDSGWAPEWSAPTPRTEQVIAPTPSQDQRPRAWIPTPVVLSLGVSQRARNRPFVSTPSMQLSIAFPFRFGKVRGGPWAELDTGERLIGTFPHGSTFLSPPRTDRVSIGVCASLWLPLDLLILEPGMAIGYRLYKFPSYAVPSTYSYQHAATGSLRMQVWLLSTDQFRIGFKVGATYDMNTQGLFTIDQTLNPWSGFIGAALRLDRSERKSRSTYP